MTLPARRRRHKYGAVPTVVDGLRFDSKGEANHWCRLQLLERAGRISELRRQVRFPIVVNNIVVGSYLADFAFKMDGVQHVQDFKGVDTPLSRFKRKCVEAQHAIRVEIVK